MADLRVCLVWLWLLALGTALCGADATGNALRVTPVYVHLEVASGAHAPLSLTLHTTTALTILAVAVDCGCIKSLDVLPLSVGPGDTALHLQATGVLPGIKTVTVRTTLGSATAQIQVITPGFGEGLHLLSDLRQAAPETQHLQKVVVIVHDLHGETRNCGCSSGSLGGIEHLAALPAALPGARLVLTGDVAGGNPAVAAALARRGWEIQPADVAVSDDPLSALSSAGILAIVATGKSAVANQRIVTPVLDRGAMANVLLLAGTTVVGQRLLPIDRTLPSDLSVLSELPQPAATVVIDHQASTTACATCHQAAHQTWASSAHARALSSLTETDQTTACAICHTTALPGGSERAANVTCTACHQGAEAHAVAPTTRTSAVTDCRSCHDAQHHPAFDPLTAWLRIQHGK